MKILPMNIDVLYDGRQTGIKNPFKSKRLIQRGKSIQKMLRVGLVIVMGVVFIFGFYMGLTLLALKILL